MQRRILPPPVKIYHSSVSWLICNYFTGQLELGTPVESPEFETNLHARLKWKLLIISTRGLDITEFILRRSATCSGPSDIYIKIRFTIMDSEGNMSSDITRNDSFYTDTAIVFRNCNENDPRDGRRLCLNTGKLTVQCDFIQDFPLRPTQSDIDVDLLALSNDLNVLDMCRNLPDLGMGVDEGISSVHSTVLKARSPCSSTSNAIRDLEHNELKPCIYREKLEILTTFQIFTRSISWVIEDFHFHENLMHSDRGIFHAYQSEDQAGELFLYPNGFSGNEKHIALLISKIVRVDFNIQCVEVFFEDDNGTEYGCKIAKTFTPRMYAFPEFITHDEFSEIRKTLLNEDNVRIVCRFSCPVGEIEHSTKLNSEVVTEYTHTNLTNGMKRLLQSEDMSDISLKSGDRIFRVHAGILAARSRYFNCLFRKLEYRTLKPYEIIVKDIEPDDLDMILKYIYYAEKIVLNLDLALKLYPVFFKYKITRLYNLCSDFLQNNVNVGNAFGIIPLAHTMKDSSLKKLIKDSFFEIYVSYLRQENAKCVPISNKKTVSAYNERLILEKTDQRFILPNLCPLNQTGNCQMCSYKQ